MALWQYYNGRHTGNVIFEPVAYGDPVPEYQSCDRIWIVDFSFPQEELLKIKQTTPHVILIDHHDTAKADLVGLDWAHFNNTKSGAVLTWEFVWGTPVPELLLYIQDRDLWQWELPDSRAVNYALRHVPKDFYVWSNLRICDLKTDGKAMMKMADSLVSSAVKKAVQLRLGHIDVYVVNSSDFASEIGNELASKSPSMVGAVWHYDHAGFHWELRSTDDGPHVGEVAKLYGGGGHANAAGFRTRVNYVISSKCNFVGDVFS
jgi:nanoRNase/pAp phosphatase (c-di-AMP/oligoRNAs hydrolase)